MMRRRTRLLQAASIAIALLLALLPLPDAVVPFRPFWMALVLAYWVLEHGDDTGLGFAFFIGLLLDVVQGTLLGEYALRLVVIAFLLDRFRSRLRFYPIWQQVLAIAALLVNDWIVTAIIHAFLGQPQHAFATLGSAAVGAVMWGPLHALLATLDRGRR
ncbi:MAG: rod shape-determining protein MreD [Proteobacteria bacterium]|nr:rod shape-determining protein MreD [Pseudomonadota bacterium]